MSDNNIKKYEWSNEFYAPRLIGGVQDIDKHSPELRPITVDQYGNLNVSISDQYTEALKLKLHTVSASGSLLASNTTIDTYTMEFNAGHSAVVNNLICIKENGRFSQFKITNVATNTITVDSPIDYAYTTDAFLSYGKSNLNLSGSIGSPIRAMVGPDFDQMWDVYGLSIIIIDDAAIDYSKFGGIGALTRGIVIRKENDYIKNFGNIKSNADLDLYGFTTQINEKTGGGEYSLVGHLNINNISGVSIRLDGSTNDKLVAQFTENLSAISKIEILVHGHVVQNL